MPIRPERAALYPKDWHQISARIRNEVARGLCQECGVKNYAIGGRKGGAFCPALPLGERGLQLEWPRPGDWAWCEGHKREKLRIIKIVLTTAHLNHDETDCRDENLRALCQRCHLRYDKNHHAKTRRSRKAIGDLFEH